MPDATWLCAAVLCAGLGMGWLALAMDVHWRQARGTRSLSRRGVVVLRSLGYGALLLSLTFCLLADTATMAVLVWMMLLAIGALSVAFVLSWRPRLLSLLTFGTAAGNRDCAR